MSRDLTPRESFLIDRMHFKECNEHFYEMKMDILVGDVRTTLPTKEQLSIRRMYPNLAITNVDGLSELAKELPEDVLKDLDKQVEMLCKREAKEMQHEDVVVDENVEKWFYGKLEPSYYREPNDEALLCYLKEKYEDLVEKDEMEEKER